jgi:hypothetical protein
LDQLSPLDGPARPVTTARSQQLFGGGEQDWAELGATSPNNGVVFGVAEQARG